MGAEIISKGSLYRTIKADILAQIRSERLKAGDKIPTEAEFMQQYQVSRITVSKALNELKEEGILIRYPSKGTFVAQSEKTDLQPEKAVAPVSDTVMEIACIMPMIADQFALSIIRGVSSVFLPPRFTLSFYQSQTNTSEDYILKRCTETGVRGILLFPVDQAYYSNQLLYMKISGFPMVLIDRMLPGIDTNYVIADNQLGGRLAVSHLYGLMHRKFVFLTKTTQDTASVHLRIQGIQERIAEYNLPCEALTILEQLDVNKSVEYYRDLFIGLVKKKKNTAFIVSESQTALFVYRIFKHIGLEIPNDVSLLCFDNPINDLADFDFFTHINQSEYDMGRNAALILQQILEKKEAPVQRKILIPTLEIRKSTGYSI